MEIRESGEIYRGENGLCTCLHLYHVTHCPLANQEALHTTRAKVTKYRTTLSPTCPNHSLTHSLYALCVSALGVCRWAAAITYAVGLYIIMCSRCVTLPPQYLSFSFCPSLSPILCSRSLLISLYSPLSLFFCPTTQEK